MDEKSRPSKKQKELLEYIEAFITQHGYGPSYREIMRALNYKSVSTVAVHVDGLIARGWLHKKNHSARSLEVIATQPLAGAVDTSHIAWLKKQIKKREGNTAPQAEKERVVLYQALEILLDQTTK